MRVKYPIALGTGIGLSILSVIGAIPYHGNLPIHEYIVFCTALILYSFSVELKQK